MLQHDSSKMLEPSPSVAQMQMDAQQPASMIVIPDKIDEEQDPTGNGNQEEEKKVSPEDIARLNIGSAHSGRSPALDNQNSPDYSEFEGDKSGEVTPVDVGDKKPFGAKADDKIEGQLPAKDRYAADSEDQA